MHRFDHRSSASAAEAISLLAEVPGAQIIAGGTDLVPLLQAGLATPPRLVDLKPADTLRTLAMAPDGSVEIGALVTLAQIERDAALAERLPLLPEAVRDAATPQLRAMATVGGNLLQRPRCPYFRNGHACWLNGGESCLARAGVHRQHAIYDLSPCLAVHPSDLAPALLALDAVVRIAGPHGTRELPVADLLAPPTAERRVEHTLAPGEVLLGLRLPPQPAGARGAYRKAMDRRAWAFALVSAAAQVHVVEGQVAAVRLVLGGVANVPWRAHAAEAALLGQPCTAAALAHAAEQAVIGATPLAQSAYKLPMARALAERALRAAAGVA